jgi:hypothetical protein
VLKESTVVCVCVSVSVGNGAQNERLAVWVTASRRRGKKLEKIKGSGAFGAHTLEGSRRECWEGGWGWTR